jgi:hypothetical protein
MNIGLDSRENVIGNGHIIVVVLDSKVKPIPVDLGIPAIEVLDPAIIQIAEAPS